MIIMIIITIIIIIIIMIIIIIIIILIIILIIIIKALLSFTHLLQVSSDCHHICSSSQLVQTVHSLLIRELRRGVSSSVTAF